MPSSPAPQPESRFSPRDFLRQRRPELFSDSAVETKLTLDRSTLEYHLDTLTSRNQEADFELFARKLAAKTICPNLLAHTGPTGGGDSKVDSETYPVAPGSTFAWYVGTTGVSATERWAFAFSAQATWRAKVGQDVAKIAATKRGYRKAFFTSSRFIPDKLRASAEDELRKKYRIDLRILDRNWILDRVFGDHLEELAVIELKLQPAVREERRKGPHDVATERELEETEARIAKLVQDQQHGFQFVAECIDAIRLSRTLDRPRTETDGRIERARRAAQEFGTAAQKLRVEYQTAWTAYWWFEDYAMFNEAYERTAALALGTANVYELELLYNLWIILDATVRRGALPVAQASLPDRTRQLETELDRLTKVEGRPSTVLQARAHRQQMALYLGLIAQDQAAATVALKKLKSIVRECKGLVGFPWSRSWRSSN